MLKKILITIIAVLTVISNANAIMVVPAVTKTYKQTLTRTNSSIIGKDYHGCKIVDAFYSNSYYIIICLKNGKLYRDSYHVERIETKCDGWKCEDYSKDIPALFEENNNE
nr:MAG TPA: hypothetical protein [Caudoviricetes sp.]